MNYTPRHYALALHHALAGASGENRKKMLERFFRILRTRNLLSRLPRILSHYERYDLARTGMRKVVVESAAPLSPEARREIKKTFGVRAAMREALNPSLMAGVAILIDDEILIDASARRQLDRLFAKK